MKEYVKITTEQKKKVLQHCRLMKYHSINAKIKIDKCIEQIKLNDRKITWMNKTNHAPGMFDFQ